MEAEFVAGGTDAFKLAGGVTLDFKAGFALEFAAPVILVPVVAMMFCVNRTLSAPIRWYSSGWSEFKAMLCW